MKENSMFDNVKFSDEFLTKDNQRGLYVGTCDLFEGFPYVLYLERDAVTFYNKDGKCAYNENKDVISEYKEEINQKELDRLAMDYVLSNEYVKSDKDIPTPNRFIYEAFKAGYNKAKE